MNDLFDPRIAEGPSELTLDAYVTGDADPEEAAAVEAWMAADPANAALVEARRAGFDAMPQARPQAMLARIRQGLDAAEVRSGSEAAADAPPPAPRRRPSLGQWLFGGLALAAAAAAVVFLARPGVEDPGDVVLTKGALALEVFRARGDAVTALVSGDSAVADDRLRFVVDNLPEGPGHVMVVGVEAGGQLFPYFPADGRSVAAHGTLRDDRSLPGSAVLDDSVGQERIWLVWCPQAFASKQLKPTNAGLATADAACRTAGFTLEKRSKP